MTLLKKSVLVLCLASCFTSFSEAQTTTFHMGDDGYANAQLGFAFPFYDKTFNQAWMYDNGVISFLNPATDQNALSPWQWSSQPISSTNAKYFIAALWADIAPTSQTTYKLDSTATSAKFSWTNIAEYYSIGGSLRLNSFSVTLNASGQIDTNYSAINLQTSNVSIGTKGDADYTQVAYYQYGTRLQSLANWTATTATPAPEPVYTPPVVEEPVSVVETAQPAVAVPAQVTTNTSTTSAVTPAPTQTMVEMTPAVAENKSSKSVTPRVSQQSGSAEADVVSAAIAVATASAEQSTAESAKQSQSQTFSFGTTSSLAWFNIKSIDGSQVSQQNTDSLTQQIPASNGKNDGLDIKDLAASPVQQQSAEQKDKPLAKNPAPIAEFGPTQPGFAAYSSVVLVDSIFYAPKSIYKGQKTVDNIRALRQLGSDDLHKRMIEMQYVR